MESDPTCRLEDLSPRDNSAQDSNHHDFVISDWLLSDPYCYLSPGSSTGTSLVESSPESSIFGLHLDPAFDTKFPSPLQQSVSFEGEAWDADTPLLNFQPSALRSTPASGDFDQQAGAGGSRQRRKQTYNQSTNSDAREYHSPSLLCVRVY